MDVSAHFKSLTMELEALRDRVRNFSSTPHWLSDGEWKESVLRSVLRAYLPAHVEPLRGFVVTPQRSSGQIDILLYDNRKPVLFRNGDLVFVTPDAVSGIVEVKSHIRHRGELRSALSSLADDAEMIRSSREGQQELFVGLFSYTTNLEPPRHEMVREELHATARGSRGRIISHVCLGCSHFAMFWSESPDRGGGESYNSWHSYELPNLAAGYFINNSILVVSGDSVETNVGAWFPATSKEVRRLGRTAFRDADDGGMTRREGGHCDIKRLAHH